MTHQFIPMRMSYRQSPGGDLVTVTPQNDEEARALFLRYFQGEISHLTMQPLGSVSPSQQAAGERLLAHLPTDTRQLSMDALATLVEAEIIAPLRARFSAEAGHAPSAREMRTIYEAQRQAFTELADATELAYARYVTGRARAGKGEGEGERS